MADTSTDANFATEWAFEKARFDEPWTWTQTKDGAVVSERVVLPEVRQEQVVFREVTPPGDALLVVPLTDHVDPPSASTIDCARGDVVGCRDTDGQWWERDLMVWTDALEMHELRAVESGCGEGEVRSRVVSFERGGDALEWEVEGRVVGSLAGSFGWS